MLCFVSLQVDLPMVWNGLGSWGFGGIEQITFSFYNIVCSADFIIFVFGSWRLPLWPNFRRATPHSGGTHELNELIGSLTFHSRLIGDL